MRRYFFNNLRYKGNWGRCHMMSKKKTQNKKNIKPVMYKTDMIPTQCTIS